MRTDVETARSRAIDALSAEGFGLLTEIDVRATLQEKLGVEVAPYRILGACNPRLAHHALSVAPEVGLLLPCNVTIRELSPGVVEVMLQNPQMMAQTVGRPELEPVAAEARSRLERVAMSLEV
jgi:uncharacterized protein (DUF302 family)